MQREISLLSKRSVRAGIEERLQAQWRPHQDEGSMHVTPKCCFTISSCIVLLPALDLLEFFKD